MQITYVEIVDLLFIFFVTIGLWTLRKDVDKMVFEVDELRREMGEMEAVVIRVIEEIRSLNDRLAKAVVEVDWSGVNEVTSRLDAAEKALQGVLPPAPAPVVPDVAPPLPPTEEPPVV